MALGKKVVGSSTVYYCTSCGKELGVQNKKTVDLVYGSCDHYTWSHLPANCYFELEVCKPEEFVKELKAKRVLVLFSGLSVYVLTPKEVRT
jgi:hypothetical protein